MTSLPQIRYSIQTGRSPVVNSMGILGFPGAAPAAHRVPVIAWHAVEFHNQAIRVVADRRRLALQRLGSRPLFTASFCVKPALNVGEVDADIETAFPVRRLHQVRAG